MATLTVTVPTAQVPRCQTAIGKKLGLVDGSGTPRDATQSEVAQFLADDLRVTVREVEQAVARTTAQAGVTDISASGS